MLVDQHVAGNEFAGDFAADVFLHAIGLRATLTSVKPTLLAWFLKLGHFVDEENY